MTARFTAKANQRQNPQDGVNDGSDYGMGRAKTQTPDEPGFGGLSGADV